MCRRVFGRLSGGVKIGEIVGNDWTWCNVWSTPEEGRRRLSTHDKLGAD